MSDVQEYMSCSERAVDAQLQVLGAWKNLKWKKTAGGKVKVEEDNLPAVATEVEADQAGGAGAMDEDLAAGEACLQNILDAIHEADAGGGRGSGASSSGAGASRGGCRRRMQWQRSVAAVPAAAEGSGAVAEVPAGETGVGDGPAARRNKKRYPDKVAFMDEREDKAPPLGRAGRFYCIFHNEH